jgi:tartrate dehydrogenase/decarboxylase / D-malate dehydrogenase
MLNSFACNQPSVYGAAALIRRAAAVRHRVAEQLADALAEELASLLWPPRRNPQRAPTRPQGEGSDMPNKRSYRIAVIPGDGIGKEVVPEGVRVLETAAKRFGFELKQDWFDFASCDYYVRHGRMMPEDWKEQVGRHDAIYFGAVGWPQLVPDHISLWGSLILFRREFDQYVNLRPVRLMPGVPCPLANRKPGDIDFWVVRENTEGEYSAIGGRMFPGTEREVVIQETVMSRVGVDRVLRFAFELAASRPKKHLTSATKSNGISITMPYWDERVATMAANYPGVRWDQYHIDILTAHFVLNPDRFDVVVASNLFGDILSDLGPACTGTIGIAPSGNINPSREHPSVFEPVHGSAPDIAGQGVANPIGQIWSGAMMLEHLGEQDAAAAVVSSIERVLGERTLRTRDLGGNADTRTCGQAVAEALA